MMVLLNYTMYKYKMECFFFILMLSSRILLLQNAVIRSVSMPTGVYGTTIRLEEVRNCPQTASTTTTGDQLK